MVALTLKQLVAEFDTASEHPRFFRSGPDGRVTSHDVSNRGGIAKTSFRKAVDELELSQRAQLIETAGSEVSMTAIAAVLKAKHPELFAQWEASQINPRGAIFDLGADLDGKPSVRAQSVIELVKQIQELPPLEQAAFHGIAARLVPADQVDRFQTALPRFERGKLVPAALAEPPPAEIFHRPSDAPAAVGLAAGMVAALLGLGFGDPEISRQILQGAMYAGLGLAGFAGVSALVSPTKEQ